MQKKQFREDIASIQHKIWSHWMQYLFSVCGENRDGSYVIPADKVKRWKTQAAKPYGELTDAEKESDLQMADWVISVINKIK